jgi:hypothetical protein
MPIYASAKSPGGNYEPAPAGTHAAICCDVVDLGVLEVSFSGKTKKQHKINICWQIEEDRDDGKPFVVRKRYTLSLHEKSGLRKDLESWRGRPFSPEELERFDLEVLIGIGCYINVVHKPNPDGGEPWANVAAIMRLPKNTAAPAIRDYVRVCDRKLDSESPAVQPDVETEGLGIDDSDIPF